MHAHLLPGVHAPQLVAQLPLDHMSDELRQTPDAARLAARLQRCVISAQAFLICHCLYPAYVSYVSTRSAQNPLRYDSECGNSRDAPVLNFGSHGSHAFTHGNP